MSIINNLSEYFSQFTFCYNGMIQYNSMMDFSLLGVPSLFTVYTGILHNKIEHKSKDKCNMWN